MLGSLSGRVVIKHEGEPQLPCPIERRQTKSTPARPIEYFALVRRRRWARVGLCISATLVTVMALTAWAAPAVSIPATSLSTSLAGSPPGVPQVTAAEALPFLTLDYAVMSHHGSDVGRFLPLSVATARVVALFDEGLGSPAFSRAYSQSSPSEFSLQFGSPSLSDMPTVYFVFTTVGAGTTTTTSWAGDLMSMTLSGPIVVSRPTITANSVFTSPAWAGSSWWGSGSPSPTLGITAADENYPTISTDSTLPQNVPSGVTVHQVASVWVGLTNSNNYLLQTGMYTDASSGMNYGQTFYEMACPSGYSCPNYAQYFGSGYLQHVSFGNDVEEVVDFSGLWTSWAAYIYDYSTGASALAGISTSSYLPNGFWPQWTQFIVEAYEANGVVQQITKFSQVNFCDAYWGSTSQTWYTYGQPYNQYQLEQASSNYNTNQGYINQNCGHNGHYGAPTVSWQNSNYNYNYV